MASDPEYRGVKPGQPERMAMEIRREAEAVARATAEVCRRELGLARHELPLKRSWRFDVRLSWSPHRTSSRGGAKGVSLALHRLAPEDPWGFCWYPEYSSFDRDPCIGGVASPDWRHCVQAVAAHEVAHTAQYQILEMLPSKRGRLGLFDLRTSHGAGWRVLYGILRREIVDPGVKAAGGWIGALWGRSAPWALPSPEEIEDRSGLLLRPVDQTVERGRATWTIRHLAFGELKRPTRVGGKRLGSWSRLCDGAPAFRLRDIAWPTDRSIAELASCPRCLLAVHKARPQPKGA